MQRILTGWTFQRALYLVMGGVVIFQSAMEQQWAGVAFGAYFASMGLFSFGCAAGNCSTGGRLYEPDAKSTHAFQEVQFEEVTEKSKRI